jgi:Na+/citrate or Na+/malate symporter
MANGGHAMTADPKPRKPALELTQAWLGFLLVLVGPVMFVLAVSLEKDGWDYLWLGLAGEGVGCILSIPGLLLANAGKRYLPGLIAMGVWGLWWLWIVGSFFGIL